MQRWKKSNTLNIGLASCNSAQGCETSKLVYLIDTELLQRYSYARHQSTCIQTYILHSHGFAASNLFLPLLPIIYQ